MLDFSSRLSHLVRNDLGFGPGRCFLPRFLSLCAVFLIAYSLAGARVSAKAQPLVRCSLWESAGASETSQEPEDLLVQARSLVDRNKATAAELLVRQHLEKHADSAPGHFLLGYILFREIQEQAGANSAAARWTYTEKPTGSHVVNFTEEKAKASLAEYTEGAKYAAPTALDLKIVGLDYVLLGDYIDASKWFEKMLQWNSGDAEGWYYLGRTKYNQNRFEEGVRAFEESLKLDPGNVKTEDNLGLCLVGLGRTEDAMAAFRKAIAWQHPAPKNPGPFIDLASVLLDQNLTEEAIPYLRTAIEISAQDSKSHELLGKAYSRLNRLQMAQVELEKAVALAPEAVSLHCMLAPVYRKQGLADKAKIEFDRCSSPSGTDSSSTPN